MLVVDGKLVTGLGGNADGLSYSESRYVQAFVPIGTDSFQWLRAVGC